MDFRPTAPPPGRLVRLGLILDTRSDWSGLSEVARMCDGAGFDALWVEDRLTSEDDEPGKEAWTVLATIARDVRRARLGAIVNPAFRPPAVLAAMARTLDDALGGRLELSFTAGSNLSEHLALGLDFPDEDAAWHRAEGYAAIVRELPRPPTLAIVGATAAAFDVAARIADDVVLPPSDPGGVAHAGISDLRCAVPNAPDMPDVLAQLTAIAIGTVDVLTPGSPRSKSPDPPQGWGGRA